MKTGYATVLVLLLAGCISSGGPQDNSTGSVPTTAPCPLEPPQSNDMSSLRVTVGVDPGHEHGADGMAPFSEGTVRVDWWRNGVLEEKALEPEGCAVFVLSKDQVPVQVYVSVPDEVSPNCSWSRAQRIDGLDTTDEVVIELLKGCY